VAEIKDSPFPDVKDPDALSVEDRERYLEYWASRTPNERLSELQRLRVAIKKVLEVVKVDWA
jgi:hypothetical protein